MTAMLLSVVSGSRAANLGIEKAPYPLLQVRGCFALLIKLYAAGLPAYTVNANVLVDHSDNEKVYQ